MSNSLFAVAIDCANAPALARFWADVLGRQVAEDSTSEHVVLLVGDGDTSGPRIVFNKVPEPKTVKNRLHLDLVTEWFQDETERLITLRHPDPRHREARGPLDHLRRPRGQRVRPGRRLAPRPPVTTKRTGAHALSETAEHTGEHGGYAPRPHADARPGRALRIDRRRAPLQWYSGMKMVAGIQSAG